MQAAKISGYTMGTGEVPQSPISPEEFEKMKSSVLFTDQDIEYLRMSYEVVKDRTDEILDVWYGFVGSQPQLLESFTSKTDGAPLGDYLGAVRARFGRWILDTARAEYNRDWLNYQHEIGLRHHRTKKNRTDGVNSIDIVPFRYLFLLAFPVTFTLKPFLSGKGHSAKEVEKMYLAWVKSCLLQLTLWSYPYIKEGDF